MSSFPSHLLFAFAMLACSAGHPLDESVDPSLSTDQAIAHGAADRGRHPSVVALVAQDPAGGHLCTAAVVAPDVVLTARHCVSELKSEGVACPSRVAQVGKTLAAESIYVHLGDDVNKGPFAARGRAVFVPSGDVLCNSDLALVALDRPLSLKPLPIARQQEPATGRKIVAVGFGQVGASGGQGLRRFRTDVPVLAVTPREFVVDESTCPGDSGGPALDAETGEILGVVSRGSVVCDGSGARNIYTRVSAFLELIDQAVGSGGTTAPAPPEGDLGDACTSGSSCASGVCANAVCSRKCGPAVGRCPSGFRCTRKSAETEGVCAKHE